MRELVIKPKGLVIKTEPQREIFSVKFPTYVLGNGNEACLTT